MRQCPIARMLARSCVLVLLVSAVALSGCARRAGAVTTVPSLPPLDVPQPPPRVLIPLQAEIDPPPPPVPEEPRDPPPEPRPAAPAATEPPRVAEEPKPEGPAAPAPPPVALQTTPAAAEGEVERAIRATMSRASTALNRIDYRLLDTGARTQYDTAKRFIQQADDAIRLRNLPFAKNLADKAAVLAAQLSGSP